MTERSFSRVTTKVKSFRSLACCMALFFLTLAACSQEPQQEAGQEGKKRQKPAVTAPYAIGETIRFEIKKLGLKLGSASLVYNGPTTLEGEETILVTFTAEGLNFYDQEKIYMDPVDMYPVLVKRDLDIWGKKEEIDEVYDQKKGSVIIIKRVKGKEEERNVIEKGKRLDNIYCFLYRYRRFGSFELGDRLEIILPTSDVSIVLKETREIEAAGKPKSAYYMESESREYSLWFGVGEKKIPLRIDGAVGVGNTKMVMTEYVP